MSDVARIVVTGRHETTVGVGIETVQYTEYEREQAFGVPLPLLMIEKLAGNILDKPAMRRVRAFSSSNSLIGEWSFNQAKHDLKVAKKEAKEKGQKTPKASKTPEEKQIAKLAKKVKLAMKEREQLAKAPKALLPTLDPSIRYFDKMAGRDFSTMRLSAVPLIHSESRASVWLTDRQGVQVVIPIHEGLYNSAVSRGKTESKDNPDVDPSKYVKRLIAEVLLESGAGQRNENGKYAGSGQRWIKGAIVCSKKDHVAIELTRADAIRVQKREARDEYKRAKRQIMHKKSTPFGKALKWQGRANNTRVEFSRG